MLIMGKVGRGGEGMVRDETVEFSWCYIVKGHILES